MKPRAFIAMALAGCATLALLAAGFMRPALAEAPAAALPALAQAQLARPQLLGQGRFRWLGLHIYDAALWIEQDSAHASHATHAGHVVPATPANPGAAPTGALPDALATDRRPLALRLRYARAFSGADIARHSAGEMARLGLADPGRRARWLAAMLNIFPDVQPGSVLVGVHLPGRGARFYDQQRLLGEIEDAEFTQAFFSLWLHPQARSPELRDALLGRNTMAARP